VEDQKTFYTNQHKYSNDIQNKVLDSGIELRPYKMKAEVIS